LTEQDLKKQSQFAGRWPDIRNNFSFSVSTVPSVVNRKMRNKANLSEGRANVTTFTRKEYENTPRFGGPKNKANQPAFGGKPEMLNPKSEMRGFEKTKPICVLYRFAFFTAEGVAITTRWLDAAKAGRRDRRQSLDE
jgi:hypothetical protein